MDRMYIKEENVFLPLLIKKWHKGHDLFKVKLWVQIEVYIGILLNFDSVNLNIEVWEGSMALKLIMYQVLQYRKP